MKLFNIKPIINRSNGQINLNAPRKKLKLPKDLKGIKFKIGWSK